MKVTDSAGVGVPERDSDGQSKSSMAESRSELDR